MIKPLVTIIITTRNSAETLGALLKSIKQQSYKRQEVIVIDNGSTDATVKVAKKYTPKVYQKGPERSAQRNFGVLKSRGQYLFFLDSDMVLTREVVAQCVEIFEQKNTTHIGGVIVPEVSFGIGFWAKTKALERAIYLEEGYFEAARFFPKKIFQKFHGYDESLTGPEDWDFPQRVSSKFQIAKVKALIRHNEGNPTLLGFAQKKYYYAKTVDTYLRKHKYLIVSSRTVYFLRPVFYKHWPKYLQQPLVSLGMFLMLSVELVYGGIGYLEGRLRRE